MRTFLFNFESWAYRISNPVWSCLNSFALIVWGFPYHYRFTVSLKNVQSLKTQALKINQIHLFCWICAYLSLSHCHKDKKFVPHMRRQSRSRSTKLSQRLSQPVEFRESRATEVKWYSYKMRYPNELFFFEAIVIYSYFLMTQITQTQWLKFVKTHPLLSAF